MKEWFNRLYKRWMCDKGWHNYTIAYIECGCFGLRCTACGKWKPGFKTTDGFGNNILNDHKPTVNDASPKGEG